ncbi:hypothetical protein [Parvularcula dongshanensis]|uniref:Uncharacterized protein n=1 Tax=Parvularcula dongshanensis TaxID=1173995 RepID=A0A840I5N5_9PROT|nr:hypothetical protein [Parvularcula dongshanensis]MBB4659504.1 hypothetical protein [Parvularcula dongshanensis]
MRASAMVLLARWRLLLLGGLLTLGASACTSVPDRYARAYDACDREVGACYDLCRYEDEAGERRFCQEQCSRRADQCFGSVSRQSEIDSAWRSASASNVAFYGRFGWWSPSYGWRRGWHGRPYSYDPWGDRWRHRGWAYGYGDGNWNRHPSRPPEYDNPYDCRGRDRAAGCEGGVRGEPAPEVTDDRPPARPGEGGYVGPNGGVFAADGTRLRYGGKPATRAVEEDRAAATAVRTRPGSRSTLPPAASSPAPSPPRAPHMTRPAQTAPVVAEVPRPAPRSSVPAAAPRSAPAAKPTARPNPRAVQSSKPQVRTERSPRQSGQARPQLQ